MGKASVTVTGTVDRCVWVVKRVLETSPKRKHELYVSLNGTDLTKATIAATQNTIGSNIFGLQNMSSSGLCDWLLRNSVWSQSSVSRWLEVSEAQAKNEIKKIANDEELDFLIVECGGTVGDIESLPFLEALRQMRVEDGAKNVIFVQVSM